GQRPLGGEMILAFRGSVGGKPGGFRFAFLDPALQFVRASEALGAQSLALDLEALRNRPPSLGGVFLESFGERPEERHVEKLAQNRQALAAVGRQEAFEPPLWQQYDLSKLFGAIAKQCLNLR